MTISQFIKKRPYLAWYIKDYNNLSEESVVEHTLNYGDFDDVKKLFKIIGIKKAAAIFKRQIKLPRNNYRPQIKNYFQLYFKRYA